MQSNEDKSKEENARRRHMVNMIVDKKRKSPMKLEMPKTSSLERPLSPDLLIPPKRGSGTQHPFSEAIFSLI